ncbi:MAG: glycosyltransferase family 2 protein [Saprospiraceae bacterium]
MNSLHSLHITIVSPVYRAEDIIDKLISEIENNLNNITESYEIILVDDGSPDNSWTKIKNNCSINRKVKGIKLSRNFGQHYAITAGLENSSGEWVIVMDCDLQDRPDQIITLYNECQKGYDIVFARRNLRMDSFTKKLSSSLFYKVFGYLTDTKQDPSIANFGIYHRKVIKAILSMKDHIRYFPTMSQWVGFRKTYVNVKHGEREAGNSSYSWKKLFELAFNNIIAFSDKPLRLTIQFGLVISATSGLIGFYYFLRYSLGYIIVSGFTSIIISLWFIAGVIIFILGIIGIYLGKVFEKVKDRPNYIIDQQINNVEK